MLFSVAYGQTGSGKTHTMGSNADPRITSESMGIIPRVIQMLFDTITEKESADSRNSYKVHIQFLEIYGEDIRDLLDRTKTSKVMIRETVNGDVFVSGAREEVVSSTTQMMKTLEEGSKNRVTASTCMNSESSRSHAIFTVILEHTIHTSSVIDDDALPSTENTVDVQQTNPLNIANHTAMEVRRSKFHFVDLAGSERIKRTKAQGTQLKEGIDINKGLLSLGNVISALGDDQKKGRVHVPYRDSKITRILQDSLGGNSKTLFICCVSPSSLNFIESVNALKYANRARNIKNKPIVNRDPTLIIIDELKELVQSLATEILTMKSKNEEVQLTDRFNQKMLEDLARLNFSSTPTTTNNPTSTKASVNRNGIPKSQSQSRQQSPARARNNNTTIPNHHSMNNSNHVKSKITESQYDDLKSKLLESDFEIQRLTEQIKMLRSNASDLCDRAIMAESERDYYKIKLDNGITSDNNSNDNNEAVEVVVTAESVTTTTESPENIHETNTNTSSVDITSTTNEKDDFITAIMKYRKENEGLRSQLLLLNNSKKSTIEEFHVAGESIENDLTSSVARVIAQTKQQLKHEAKRLEKVAEECGLSKSSLQQLGSSEDTTTAVDYTSDSDNEADNKKEEDEVAEEQSFQLRQKMLSSQLVELGESIILKENLVLQLKKSQDQYALMKAFYEQKLTMLQKEVDDKEGEREQLLNELKDISTLQHQTEVHKDKEKKLRDEVKRKDDELKNLKKKQDELSNLSQVQTRYLQQIRKMESDIEGMKRQKVDKEKVLQVERKKHITALHDKVKEVEKLKTELMRKTGEIKKLSLEKNRAEERVKDAIREGARKRRNDSNLNNVTKLSNRAIVKHLSMKNPTATPRFLTLDELKTKKLLETAISKINQRETAIDLLKRQCDQQLSLLSQRDDLENQKKTILSNPESINSEELVLELDEKINSLNQQLKLRNNNIMKAQATLDQGEEISDIYDRTIELLKRNLSPSLLRMLFEMVVKADQSTHTFKSMIEKNQQKHDLLRQEVDNERNNIIEISRKHEQEITQITNDYEEKLQGLFENSSVVRAILLESQSASSAIPPNSHDEETLEKLSKDSSIDSYKMVIAILNDKTSYLKNQLSILNDANDTFKLQLTESNIISKQYRLEIEESKSLIEFLENERHLFREMANDYKSGILSFGGSAGQSIIKQIQERAMEKEKECALRNPQGFKKSSKFEDLDLASVDNDGPDDDTESVMNEFNDIAEEINRTGNLTVYNGKGKGVVYDRLTNPINYTGAMKNIFNNDLLSKKARVQKIKSQVNVPHNKNSSEEPLGKENHEPIQQTPRLSETDSLNDSITDASVFHFSRASSTTNSPATKRKSSDLEKGKSNTVSDRLYSVTTESTRMKQK